MKDTTPTSKATPVLANTNPVVTSVRINTELLFCTLVIPSMVSVCILFKSLYFISVSTAAINAPQLTICKEVYIIYSCQYMQRVANGFNDCNNTS